MKVYLLHQALTGRARTHIATVNRRHVAEVVDALSAYYTGTIVSAVFEGEPYITRLNSKRLVPTPEQRAALVGAPLP